MMEENEYMATFKLPIQELGDFDKDLKQYDFPAGAGKVKVVDGKTFNDLGDFAKDLSQYMKEPATTTATTRQTASELTITIKNEEKRQITKHLLYEVYTVSDEDMLIKSLIGQALQQFNDDPDDIKIRITLTVL